MPSELRARRGVELAARLGEAIGQRVVLVEQVGDADGGREVFGEVVVGAEVEQRVGADVGEVRPARKLLWVALLLRGILRKSGGLPVEVSVVRQSVMRTVRSLESSRLGVRVNWCVACQDA